MANNPIPVRRDQRLTITISAELRARLDVEAQRQDRPISSLVEMLLWKVLKP
jgi:hypothetical protein